jgi:hypothetical protein
MEDWAKNKRYGHLQINYADGKIVNVNRVESFKVSVSVGDTAQTRIEGNGSDVQL